MKLLLNALSKFLCGLLFVGILLFVPAGGFDYVNGWLFLGLLFIPMLIIGIVLFLRSSELLKKRLNGREEEKAQKVVVALSGLLFVTGFVVAGLDYRFGWSRVPLWVVIVAAIVLILSYALYGEVMRENAHLSRTVEVTEGQEIIDSGLYGLVRHPMYSATIWLFLSIPLVLGSWLAFLCFVPYIPIIVFRVLNEEAVLKEKLDGYTEYMRRVKYRLIPYVW